MIPAVKEGLCVLHLFYKFKDNSNLDSFSQMAEKFSSNSASNQIVPCSILGHKADFSIMATSQDFSSLRDLQSELEACSMELSHSYVSITEVSEYGDGLPEQMKKDRLYPILPPEDKLAWCFYPMSKKRDIDANWYMLDFDTRKSLMAEHGKSGRTFKGRLVQLITSSTGLDDFEWGVTLFGSNFDDLKDAVYTMRFDEASAKYGEFDYFYTGHVVSVDQVGSLI